MEKPRVIIADMDFNYIIPLQLKFVESFFDKIDIEIITERAYFEELLLSPQKAEILIVSEDLYEAAVDKHNIENVFVMMEQLEEGQTDELNVNRIFKYTSIKEIFNEITGKSADSLEIKVESEEPQIILVCSACGGVGKTTVALGISACLTKNYKRVLYIDAEGLQSFQRMIDNKTPITTSDVYAKLVNPTENIYNEVKHVIRQEIFGYLPPFKASLVSLGMKYSIYREIALGAKKSADYDYIIIDSDSYFDEEKTKLIDIANKVILVTKQNEASVFATNLLISNINATSSEKFIFICNNFNKEYENALISPNMTVKFTVSDYIDHFMNYDKLKSSDLSKESSIQRTAFLVM